MCYKDVEACLERGKLGIKEVLIDNESIDRVLKKFEIGLTVQQALDAEEGQIVNGCLILKEEYYPDNSFENREDFKSVLALKLKRVSG